jgi:hypothetical protein
MTNLFAFIAWICAMLTIAICVFAAPVLFVSPMGVLATSTLIAATIAFAICLTIEN